MSRLLDYTNFHNKRIVHKRTQSKTCMQTVPDIKLADLELKAAPEELSDDACPKSVASQKS